jgi:hypothetical protein
VWALLGLKCVLGLNLGWFFVAGVGLILAAANVWGFSKCGTTLARDLKETGQAILTEQVLPFAAETGQGLWRASLENPQVKQAVQAFLPPDSAVGTNTQAFMHGIVENERLSQAAQGFVQAVSENPQVMEAVHGLVQAVGESPQLLQAAQGYVQGVADNPQLMQAAQGFLQGGESPRRSGP